MKNLSPLTALICISIVGLLSHTANAQLRVEFGQALPPAIQLMPARRIENAAEQEQQEQQEEQAAEKEAEEDVVEAARITGEEPGDREIRLSLWDGTVVMGDVDIDYLKVETEFGKLQVPISNIINFRPGLDSFPQLTEKIDTLVQQLDDRDFQKREQAHRELVQMGPSIRNVKIREEIDEMIESEVDWEADGQSFEELVQGDTIQTGDFTIVGKILQPEFTLASKYGQLTISLSDIQAADRTWMQTTQTVSKTVNVAGNSFFQTTPVSTKIRVKKGDRIKIRASGTVQWATWGNISSSPTGITNQGNWSNFNCGTLIARIGTGTDYLKVGERGDFVAKTNGVLQLGIAMRDNYAQQNNYQWPGKYKAKITVTPGEEE